MISDLDIYRTARMLIDEHGEEASIEAAMRADEFLANGNLDGQGARSRKGVPGDLKAGSRDHPVGAQRLFPAPIP